MRIWFAVSIFFISIVLAVSCTTAPPAPLGIAVAVSSSPEKAAVFLHGKSLGTTPISFTVSALADVLEVSATLPNSEVVETRVRILSPTRAELLFRFGTEPGPLATRLGLTKILVFDNAATTMFDIDRAEIKADFLPLLREQAAILNRYFPGVDAYVCGHTDDTGTSAHNLQLSLQRAQAVTTFLASCNVRPARLVTQGFGEDYPVESNATSEGRALNRRTEIVLPR